MAQYSVQLKREPKHQCSIAQRKQKGPTEEQSRPLAQMSIPWHGQGRTGGGTMWWSCSTQILGTQSPRSRGGVAAVVWPSHQALALTVLGTELSAAMTHRPPLPYQWLVTNCIYSQSSCFGENKHKQT